MSLDKILDLLKNNAPRKQVYISRLWTDGNPGITMVNYADFIAGKIEEIKLNGSKNKISKSKDWTRNAVVYNLFLRLFTAFDHDQDGKLGESKIGITLSNDGIRETGTFLKTIALLPYIKKLGVNTIHLLPITEIGKEGRKGDLGSPYAIKNPFKLDPCLADPIIKIGIEEQYKALVEAAKLMGFRIVQEFIFRTAAMDSDLIEKHPEWFYWIDRKSKYGPPKFSDDQLKIIKKIPKGNGKHLPPPEEYRKLFSIPPSSVEKNLKIASAFADWPPDDLQPPWTDVTYLRLYNYDYNASNNFNYIAYNTIRFYDPELAQEKKINKKLWDEIVEIIPYYQKNFGINGAMIDMGHALPPKLKKGIIDKARKIDPAFAFWDENFENTKGTKKEGYNAVIGGAWYNITKRNGFRKLILSIGKNQPLPFFGTPETHNSPRYGFNNKNKKVAAWILFNLLPDAVPFIHNGFELHEKLPVNTGLNFNQKALEHLADKPLALFYKTSLNWNTRKHIIDTVTKIQKLRVQYPWIFDGKNLELMETDNQKVLGFYNKKSGKEAIILFNTNFSQKESFSIKTVKAKIWRDLISENPYDFTKLITLGSGKVLFATND